MDWWDQAPDESHSLQPATTLATSSAEPPTFGHSKNCSKLDSNTLVLVLKEAISSPSSSRMKAVGTAVWVVGSNTAKEREISPVLSSTRGMLSSFREAPANSLKLTEKERR